MRATDEVEARRRAPRGKARVIAVAMAALSAGAGARTASAGDIAAAEALFQEAKELAKQGKYAEACPKFEASYRNDRTLGTLLNLADCHERVGRIAAAWAEWGEGAEWARKQGDERAEFATKRRDALAPRLPRLQVDVRQPAAGLEVLRDGGVLDPGAFGTALPVDPGEHMVAVRRGEQILKQERVQAVEGSTAKVALDLTAIDRASPPPRKPGAQPAHAAGPASSSTQKTVGFVVGGVGIAAVVTAGVLEIVALSKKGDAEQPDACVNRYCSPAGLDAIESAQTFADAGQWVGIGGLVAVAVGATLVLTAPRAEAPVSAARLAPAEPAPPAQPRSARRPWISPWATRKGGGVAVGGAL